jgi:hypothetical protein
MTMLSKTTEMLCNQPFQLIFSMKPSKAAETSVTVVIIDENIQLSFKIFLCLIQIKPCYYSTLAITATLHIRGAIVDQPRFPDLSTPKTNRCKHSFPV